MAESAERQHGELAFFSVDTEGGLSPTSRWKGERETWATIVSANLGGSRRSDLLFYDASAGEAEICFVDYQTGLQRKASHTGWRTTWSHIVPGRFRDDPWDGLLFYDRAMGDVELCRTDGLGRLLPFWAQKRWRPGWDLITPGRFVSLEGTDLLCYDREGGVLAFYRVEPDGHLACAREYREQFWDWEHMVTLAPGSGARSELLAYSRRDGLLRLYAVEARGRLRHIKTHEGWRRGWDVVVPMPVLGRHGRRVLFYDRSFGLAQLVDVDQAGDIHLVRQYEDWKKTWRTIVPGQYTADSVCDLMFYDRYADFVEADKARHALGCRYEVLGSFDGPLGLPLLDLERVASGWVRRFRRGDIYWRSDLNANEVYGPIFDAYRRTGGPTGPLGFPTSIPTPWADGRVTYQSFDGGVLVLDAEGQVALKDAVAFRLERIEQALPIADGPEWRRNQHNAELVLRVTVLVNGNPWNGYSDRRIPDEGVIQGTEDLGTVIEIPLTGDLRLEVVVRAFDADVVGSEDYLGTWRLTYTHDELVSTCLAGGQRVERAPIHVFERKSDAVEGTETLLLTYAVDWADRRDVP